MPKNDEDDALYEAALVDLARSGLDEKDFKKLKLEVLDRDDTEDLVGEARGSYKIPYFDIAGKAITYYRVRFLENGKKKFAKADGNHRYSQPANSAPHVYLPPYMDWQRVAKDPTIPIVFTEGEKKAAIACKQGMACIALGGVWSFKSEKRDWEMLPELQTIVWKGRNVEICYDSDVMHKAQVRMAMSAMAHVLNQTQAPQSIHFVYLDAETTDDGKTSLDDYLVAHGIDGYANLPRQEYKGTARIQALNQRVCVVTMQDKYFSIDSGKYLRNFGQVRDLFAHMGSEIVDGKRTKLAIELWNENPARRTVKDVLYIPGEPEVSADNELNLWRPTDVQPVKKKPVKWLDIVHYIMRKPEYAKWFLQWLAYPIQNPGTKLLSAVFVHGRQQGVGKTLIVDPVMEFAYGKDNFYRLDNDALQSQFNSYTARRQFVVTNEIYLSSYKDRRAAMGRLKDMITREKVEMRELYQPRVRVTDYCNYYLTSQHADALELERNDRRFFVIEAPEERLPQSTYNEFDEWIRSDGAGAVLHYLQNLDLTSFNPKAAAPHTVYKEQVIDVSMNPVEIFVEQVERHPKEVFTVNGNESEWCLRKAEDLLHTFVRNNPESSRWHVTINKFARQLTETKLLKRKVRLSSDSPQITLYCVLNEKEWAEKSNKAWAEHYKLYSKTYGGKGK